MFIGQIFPQTVNCPCINTGTKGGNAVVVVVAVLVVAVLLVVGRGEGATQVSWHDECFHHEDEFELLMEGILHHPKPR